MGQQEEGLRILNRLLEQGSLIFSAHADLYIYEYVAGNREKAAVHRRWLEKLTPWHLARMDSTAFVHARARGATP